MSEIATGIERFLVSLYFIFHISIQSLCVLFYIIIIYHHQTCWLTQYCLTFSTDRPTLYWHHYTSASNFNERATRQLNRIIAASTNALFFLEEGQHSCFHCCCTSWLHPRGVPQSQISTTSTIHLHSSVSKRWLTQHNKRTQALKTPLRGGEVRRMSRGSCWWLIAKNKGWSKARFVQVTRITILSAAAIRVVAP